MFAKRRQNKTQKYNNKESGNQRDIMVQKCNEDGKETMAKTGEVEEDRQHHGRKELGKR